MAIIKNEYPILEHDTGSAEILRPEFGMQGLRLPKKEPCRLVLRCSCFLRLSASCKQCGLAVTWHVTFLE